MDSSVKSGLREDLSFLMDLGKLNGKTFPTFHYKRHSKWKQAARKELRSLQEHKTWTLTELPQGRRAVGCKWVFKLKHDENVMSNVLEDTSPVLIPT